MKAFVTGATGFVGSHLVDRLLSMNYEVFCLKRKTSNMRWLEGKNVNLVEGDLFDNNVLGDVIKKVDFVFHVAGVVKSKNKDGFFKGNVEATKNLIEIANKVNPNLKRFVYISSLAACGPNPDDKPLTEDYIPRPVTTYGISKRAAEKEILKFRDKLPVTIVRPPAIYGPRDAEILIYFQTYKKGLNSIIGFDKKYLSLVYVEDFVTGIILAAKSEIKSGSIFFISDDGEYNWNEIGVVTSKLLNKKSFKIRIPHFVVYTVGSFAQMFSIFSKNAATLNIEKCFDITRKKWVCSNEKAKSELGFRPEYNLERGFKKTIEWYKENKWL
jgi:nucleoside-diphosphate-sugar epimerase